MPSSLTTKVIRAAANADQAELEADGVDPVEELLVAHRPGCSARA